MWRRGGAARAGASHGGDRLRALRDRRGGCGHDGEKRPCRPRRAPASRGPPREGHVHGLRERMRAVGRELRCREDALLRQRQQVRAWPRRTAAPMGRWRTCHPARSAIASCPQRHRRRAAPDRVVWRHRAAGESRLAAHRPHGLDGAVRVPALLAHVAWRARLQRHAAPDRLRGRPHERGVGDGAFRERVLSGQDVARALFQPVRGRLRCRLHAALHAQLPLPGPDRIRQRARRQRRDGPKRRRSRAHRVARARQLPSRAICTRRGLDGAVACRRERACRRRGARHHARRARPGVFHGGAAPGGGRRRAREADRGRPALACRRPVASRHRACRTSLSHGRGATARHRSRARPVGVCRAGRGGPRGSRPFARERAPGRPASVDAGQAARRDRALRRRPSAARCRVPAVVWLRVRGGVDRGGGRRARRGGQAVHDAQGRRHQRSRAHPHSPAYACRGHRHARGGRGWQNRRRQRSREIPPGMPRRPRQDRFAARRHRQTPPRRR